jgi:hypothetical protein
VSGYATVLVDSGTQLAGFGRVVDLDAVFDELIAPAVRSVGLEPLRVSLSQYTRGVLAAPDEFTLCEHAVVDLATGGPELLYRIGQRDAIQGLQTVAIAPSQGVAKFAALQDRCIAYGVTELGKPTRPARIRRLIADALTSNSQTPAAELVRLLDGSRLQEVDHLKSDLLRRQLRYDERLKAILANATVDGVDALRALERQLRADQPVHASVFVDLLLSYRAVSAWQDMVDLTTRMPAVVAETTLVREQLAFALNRLGRVVAAKHILYKLLRTRGPSSETFGLLGRVYKDQWSLAQRSHMDMLRIERLLRQAIAAYRRGFQTDSRDAYPGINAVMLLEIHTPGTRLFQQLLPVVRFAVEQHSRGHGDYWDYATLLELAMLERDEWKARTLALTARAAKADRWERSTTIESLRTLRYARARRGDPTAWMAEIESVLEGREQRHA